MIAYPPSVLQTQNERDWQGVALTLGFTIMIIITKERVLYSQNIFKGTATVFLNLFYLGVLDVFVSKRLQHFDHKFFNKIQAMLKKSQPFSDVLIAQPQVKKSDQHLSFRTSQEQSKLIQRIISSNQELIHEQMMKIRQLQKQNYELELRLKSVTAKYEALLDLIHPYQPSELQIGPNHQNQAENDTEAVKNPIYFNIDESLEKIVELQQKLSAVKVELAIKSNQLEVERSIKFQIHNEESSKKSRKTSISEDSFDTISRMFQSRITQYNYQDHNKNDGQNMELVASWSKVFEKYGTSQQKIHRFKEKSAHLIKKFIPKQMRAKIWPICIQNKMGITNSLYMQIMERRQKGWVSEKVRSQIDKDIKRSFSVKTHRQISSGIVVEVIQFLENFHIFRPDIGYIQGMTYPVLVLIPVLGKVNAFNLLCNLILGNPFFRKLFGMEGSFLSRVCRCFELILEDSLPQLSRKFKEMAIHSEIYLVEWLFSLFSRGLTIETTLKFWDHLLFFEEVAIFRMALAIFQQLGPVLLELNYEQTLSFLRQYSINIQENKLLQALSSSKLTKEKILKSFNRVKI